jgi:hypothetical protein
MITNTEVTYIHIIFWISALSSIALLYFITKRLDIKHDALFRELGGKQIMKNTKFANFVYKRKYMRLDDKHLRYLGDACIIMTITAGLLGIVVFFLTPASGITFNFLK